MNRTAVKNYAIRARRDFQKIVTERANALGIGAKEIAKAEPAGDMVVIKGRPFPKGIEAPRRDLASRVQRDGFDVVMENMAYTLFNRFCALRFMEVNGYLPFRVFSSVAGDDTPELLKHAVEAAEALDVGDSRRREITDLKMRGDQDQKLYSMLLLAQCNALSKSMPFLFERPNDVTELLMPENLLHSDSVIRDLVEAIDEADWQEIEIVGWLYQFYISEKKDQVIGKVVKKEDIPAATQLFTPRWIVQYMVENSLGRLWLQSHPDSGLKNRMDYYIDEPRIDANGRELEASNIRVDSCALVVESPDEITCMDSCCGSGHILVYMFDLLYAMYEEAGYIPKDIPRMILENNLFGLDIDERAAQLSGFALMMKARERDPLFLQNAVQPHVMAIEESNGIDLQAEIRIEGKAQRSPFESADALFADEGLLPMQQSGGAVDNPLKPFAPLVRFFEDAKNYGSLLRVPDTLAVKLDELDSAIAKLRGSGALFATAALPRLARLVRQAKMLAGKYHISATNPPYMGGKGMNPAVKEFAKEQYLDSKSDLFAMFIERCIEILQPHGYSAMITMQSWMFLSSYEALRSKLLTESFLSTMAHLGPRGFDSISGEVVQTTAFVLERCKRLTDKGAYLRLVDGSSEKAKADQTLEAIRNPDCGWFFRASAADFKKIPGSPIAYWVSDKLRSTFSGRSIRDLTISDGQTKSGNNDKYLRLLWEVRSSDVGKGKKWVKHPKGGDFRKWFGNLDSLIEWSEPARQHYRKDHVARILPEYLWWRKGFCWTLITSAKQSFRRVSDDEIFNLAAPTLFPKDESQLNTLLAFVNTKIAQYIAKTLNPTLNMNVGEIQTLPIVDDIDESTVGDIAQSAIDVTKEDWDSWETSWDFQSLPLLQEAGSLPQIQHKIQLLTDNWQRMTEHLADLERENNRIFIDAYGLQDELTPDVPLEEITLTCNPVYRYGAGKAEAEYERLQREDTMKELISYAVGCMMGRYSPDTQGLQFAGGVYDHEKACAAAPRFHPDADGILPVLSEAYFEDDVTARFAEFLKATFGPEHLGDNLRFVAEAIGIKGSESPQDAIRRFLANDFFKYHTRMYKKRPIYWLFSSGKERAFQALVYLHRYTPATLARMRTGYLHELQNKMRARAEDLEAGKDAATSTAQSNRIGKEITKLRKQLEELRLYDEKLHHYADQRIDIDLDDGVKHNYGLFGDLLADVKAITGDKE